MATPKEIELKAQEVELLSRETDGINDLITSITGVDTWTVITFVRGDLIDSLIQQLHAAKDLLTDDELQESVLIFNTGNNPVLTDDAQIDAVGDHLKAVFLPDALAAKTAQRNTAIDELQALKDAE